MGQFYFKDKQRNLQKKRSDLWLPEMGGGGEDKLKEGSQKVKSPSYKIN